MANTRADKLIVEVNPEDVQILIDWKRGCLNNYGMGGIKKRLVDIIKEDLKKLNSEKERKK